MTGERSGTDGRTGRDESAETSETAGTDGTAGGTDAGRHTPGETAFVLDAMLGKLSTYLRMCGYDATYTGERGLTDDETVLAVAHTEDRLVVTRDRALARRADRSVLLSTREVTDQLRELQDAGFALALADEPAQCSACNRPLETVDRTEPTPEYAPPPHEEPVWRCRGCGQHFWKGSHWDDVASTLDRL